MRYRTLLSLACTLVASSAVALAQGSGFECKKTETQPECHARLKCRASEELDECQKRLRAAAGSSGGGGANERDDRGGGAADDGGGGGGDDAYRESGGGRRGGGGGGEGRRTRQRRGGGGEGRGMRDFSANKTFGLGLELGEPTGLGGKYFLSESGALDFGIGWIYRHYYYGDGFHVYGDYLWHPASLASTRPFELPFYIGVGLRYWDFRYCDVRVCVYDGSAVGIRVPVGVSFDFNDAPLDIFIQLVPVLDFVSGAYYMRFGDREHFGIDLSAGIRYWFR